MKPLDGLRIVEGSAFVAAPLGGMSLAQLGADVIRFDNIGGGLLHLRSRVRAARADGDAADVLDWRLIAVHP